MWRWFISATILFFLIIHIHSVSNQTPSEEDEDPPELRALQISSSASFKIAVFADLHYGEAEWIDWGPLQDANSDMVMSTILDKETPGQLLHDSLIGANPVYV